MRIFANKNGSDHSVKVSEWKSGDGKMPRQASKCAQPLVVKIDKKEHKVYHNLSKSNVQYYYVQLNGKWHWTRDDFSAQSEYTFKAPKAPEVKKEEVK